MGSPSYSCMGQVTWVAAHNQISLRDKKEITLEK